MTTRWLLVWGLALGACGGDDGTGADAAVADAGAPDAATIHGVVQDRYGRPLEGVRVGAIGHVGTSTAADGTFALTDVAPPYDLAVLDQSLNGDQRVLVYQGLTRLDPGIRLPGGPYTEADQTADVRIDVHLATPYLGAEQAMDALVELPFGGFSSGPGILSGETDGPFFPTAKWGGSPTASMEVLVTQLELHVGEPPTLLGAGRTVFTVTSGQPTTTSLDVAAVPFGTVTASVVGEESITFDLGLHARGTRLVGFLGAYSGAQLALPAPDSPDYDLDVRARGTDWEYECAGLHPGDVVTVTPRHAVALLAPDEFATVAPTQVFSWESFGPGVHIFSFRAAGAPEDVHLTLFTTATEVTLPDLSTVQITLPGGARQWGVGARSDATSTDDVATVDLPLGYEPPLGERYVGAGTSRQVTISP
jgi:hypothetical protein